MGSAFIMLPEMHSFSALKNWLKMLPDQVVGLPSAICETGELYVEFSRRALSRPEDVEVIERQVAEQMAISLAKYLENKSGRIYWRTPFKSEVAEHAVVVRYDEDGPDTDFLTDRKCVMDKNWKSVSCYCRLYRAALSCGLMLDKAKAA